MVEWIKLPVFLKESPLIERLIAQEGMRGFGLYFCIILRIYSTKCRYLTIDQCLAIKETACSRYTVRRVVFDFGLFQIDEEGHVFSTIAFLEESDDDAYLASGGASGGASAALAPTPACVPYYNNIKNKKENKKNDYHHSKKDDDGGDDAPQPVAMDVASLIRSIPLQSAWTETALMRCDPTLRQLAMTRWEQTKEQFLSHVIANCRESHILTQDDAKRYLLYYLTNATTARQLREHLAQQLREEQQRQLEQLMEENK